MYSEQWSMLEWMSVQNVLGNFMWTIQMMCCCVGVTRAAIVFAPTSVAYWVYWVLFLTAIEVHTHRHCIALTLSVNSRNTIIPVDDGEHIYCLNVLFWPLFQCFWLNFDVIGNAQSTNRDTHCDIYCFLFWFVFNCPNYFIFISPMPRGPELIVCVRASTQHTHTHSQSF